MEDRGVEKYQAEVVGVDLEGRSVRCKPVVSEEGGDIGIEDGKEIGKEFTVSYDKVVICPGNVPNTFGIPGVEENAVIVTDVPSARRLRARILDCLELSSLPSPALSPSKLNSLLHFAIIGGGPTGIEIAAEVDELIQLHLRHVYPKEVVEKVRISVYDVKGCVLQGVFGEELQGYAMRKLGERKGVLVKAGADIRGVGRGVG